MMRTWREEFKDSHYLVGRGFLERIVEKEPSELPAILAFKDAEKVAEQIDSKTGQVGGENVWGKCMEIQRFQEQRAPKLSM